MNVSFKKDPIKKIGSDTFAIDFSQAEQLGIKLYQGGKPNTSSSVAVSMDGTLYLNTKNEDYPAMREVYETFSEASTENMIKAYTLFDAKYPDAKEPEDIDKYNGIARGEAIVKVMLKYELLRREYKAVKIQPLINLLFHGERV